VVADSQNGFVVKEGDVSAFAGKISQLIEDEGLRKQFSQASIERAKLFNVDSVMAQWRKLLEELAKQRT
jgi:glycosyltransferase involved in cell wall biosynthesis